MRQKLQTLKGFRDFLPKDMDIRNEVIKRLTTIFERYGFLPLQTPALEYQEILLGKYGPEAEKLMYLFEDPGARSVGLKYDLTVPLARVVASYPQLTKPFKRYQIQTVWRADKPQKGRYREITMCDIDTIGSSSPLSDAEILAIVSDSLSALDFEEFETKVNSREVLFWVMETSGVNKEKWLSVIQSLDKLDKKSKEEVQREISEKGLDNDTIKGIFKNLKGAKPNKYLNTVIDLANQMSEKSKLVFDPTLSRGLDYYTGPIFETIVKKPEIGSITGGGRYDNLIKNLGGVDSPAVGTSFGLDRIADVISELGLWENKNTSVTNVLVTIFNKDLADKSIQLATNLRQNGINTELYNSLDTKLDKQLKYADNKGIKYAVILGPEEVEADVYTLKNLYDKTQSKFSIQDLIEKIR